MKGQLYSASHQSLQTSHEQSRTYRTYLRPWVKSPMPRLYYNWTTSLPKHWKKITPRPVPLKSGEKGTRSTLDFLRETMHYIDQIATPRNSHCDCISLKLHQRQCKSRSKTSKHSPLGNSLEHCQPVNGVVSFPRRIWEKEGKKPLRALSTEPNSPRKWTVLRSPLRPAKDLSEEGERRI